MVYYISKVPLTGLEQYPDCKFVDGDTKKITLIDSSPTPGMSLATSDPYNLGRRVHADNVPTTMRWSSAPSRMTDYDTPLGFPCVSPHMKAIIERFEPDVHQFFSLKVVNKKGEQIAEHWLWVVCNLIDSVDRENTTLILRNGRRWVHPMDLPDEDLPVSYDRSRPVKLVFNKDQIADRHFWRDPLLLENNVICSDAAGEALDAGNLTAVSLRHWETI